MCELLGISSDRPLNLSTLLGRFGQRGGADADNPDGWGFAYREDNAWCVHKAPEAAVVLPDPASCSAKNPLPHPTSSTRLPAPTASSAITWLDPRLFLIG